MKRITTVLLFILFSIILFAQGDTIPGSGFETIQSPFWKVYTLDEDSTIWMYGGNKYGWTQLVPFRKYKKLLDSAQVKSDTLTWDATKYDIDTLHQKTIDSLLIHRTEIDELKNQSDSLSVIELDYATVQEALIGNDSTKIMTPRTNRDSDTLLYVPFYGAAEDVYSDHNATFDTLRSQAMAGDTVRIVFVNNEGTLFDSLIHVGNSDIVLNLADILEAQVGLNDSLMTALRTAEQLTLNAVPYYNVKEDIYSNFDATFDSIFASNLYQETLSTTPTGTGGVYDKEVSTNNIEVYLNGVLQRENVNYTQTETQITFIREPKPDDYITIKYK